MRIALIADIHGNAVALEAALRHLEPLSCDEIICLGDVAGFGPQPRTCLRRLRDLGVPVVMGNADAELLGTPPAIGPSDHPRMVQEIDAWCAEQLDEEDRDFVRSFETAIARALPHDRTLLCYHGSPISYDHVLRSTTPDDEVAQMLANASATLLAGGHTHEPMLRRHDDRLLVNPGSVGLPFERRAGGEVRNPAWAEYAVLHATAAALDVTLGRAPVEATEVVRAAERSGMPHAEAWAAGWQE